MGEIGSSADVKNFLEYLDAAEIDGFRTALVNILLENTDLDEETIYELVFNKGRKIIWC